VPRMNEHGPDLIRGNLWNAMLRFSVPLIASNLLQAVYNIVDMIIVGRFAGSAGLSAVSIGGQATMVALCIVMGISNAASVMVSQLVGAQRQREIASMLRTMELVFAAAALVLTALAWIFTHPLLTALNTPPEAYTQAVWYLRICMAGTVFVYLYNLMTGVLRGVGDARTPLLLVAVSSVVNLLLDLLLVGAFRLGAGGAAAATTFSQLLCCLLIFPLSRKRHAFLAEAQPGGFRFDREKLAMLLKIGLPQSLQFTLTELSFLLIAGVVNLFGVYASAAAGAVARLDSFAVLASKAMMGAIITVTGQNIGAGRPERALRGMGIGLLYAMPISLVFYLLSLIRPEMMLGLFTTEPPVLAAGAPYLKALALSFVLESVMFCMMGLLTGAGHTLVTLSCALVSAFVVRYSLARLFSITMGMGFVGVGWAYPFAPAASLVICTIFLLTGRWKTNRVRM
jgi:putative MATE family efflux protein